MIDVIKRVRLDSLFLRVWIFVIKALGLMSASFFLYSHFFSDPEAVIAYVMPFFFLHMVCLCKPNLVHSLRDVQSNIGDVALSLVSTIGVAMILIGRDNAMPVLVQSGAALTSVYLVDVAVTIVTYFSDRGPTIRVSKDAENQIAVRRDADKIEK